MTVLLDPTNELSPALRMPLAMPTTLRGRTVALLDLSKPRGDVYLDRIDELLREQGIATRRYRKPTFTRVAPAALLAEIAAQCDVAVEGLAD